MSYFLHILLNNVIPIGIMIVLGVTLYRAFHLDIKTFSKLIFYLFTPVLIFKLLYESDISGRDLLQVVAFIILFLVSLYVVADVTARLRGLKGGMRSAMRNSVIFYNSGNYALPLNQLVFSGNPYTMSVQMMVMTFQALLPNTYGIYAVNAHKASLKQTIRTILHMPIIYAIPLAFLLRGFQVDIPHPIYVPITYIADGYTAIALLTLGIQLGQMQWKLDRWVEVALANVLRLVVGPLLGFGIVLLLDLKGLMAQALVLSCSVPTSLNSVLLAVEFDNEPEFASQVAFTTTVLSMITVTIVISLLRFIP